MAQFDLTGRTAFVTGATGGLGRRFARILAEAGAAVAIAGRHADRLAALKEEIERAGGRCVGVAFDVTDDGQVGSAFDEAEAALGPTDILVNNAGMSIAGSVIDLPLVDFDTVLRTDLRAPYVLARETARRMITRGEGGRIINIASVAAFRVLPGITPYCIAKAALAMMTQCLAREWARHQINVNAICPGYIETELNSDWFASEKGRAQMRSLPRRRLIETRDIDGVLLLLACDASRAITGSLITVDDAQTL
jgi:NAD(P)-dependent dehydrogenase (short-subunit alcohol dehydrogenase family)